MIHSIDDLKIMQNLSGKICIIGASGWIGLNALSLLRHNSLLKEVKCFGSTEKKINLLDFELTQEPLEKLSDYDEGYFDLLLNFAFLTEDKLVLYGEEEFKYQNSKLINFIANEVYRLKVRHVVTISSGAVYRNREKQNSYGDMKIYEENKFKSLAKDGKTQVVIPRLFNLSGPFINKMDRYMISSLISQGFLNNEIKIFSDRKVFRSFLDIKEFILTFLSTFKPGHKGFALSFDATGKEIIEIGSLAKLVKDKYFVDCNIIRKELSRESEDNYYGDRSSYESVQKEKGIKNIPLEEQLDITYEYLKGIILKV